MNKQNQQEASNTYGQKLLQMPASKAKGSLEITHSEFLSFLGNFYEAIAEPLYRTLTPQPPEDVHQADRESYRRYQKALKNRLCNCYIFDETVPVEDVHFTTPLIPKQSIDHITDAKEYDIGFFIRHSILSAFEMDSSDYKDAGSSRKAMRNNDRRRKILAAVAARARVSGYFQAYNIFHQDLETIYKKTQLRKRNVNVNAEIEGITEGLDRLDKFYAAFGKPDQFTENAFIYDDILSSESSETSVANKFEYLR